MQVDFARIDGNNTYSVWLLLLPRERFPGYAHALLVCQVIRADDEYDQGRALKAALTIALSLQARRNGVLIAPGKLIAISETLQTVRDVVTPDAVFCCS
ncbi:hypothetical protein KTAU_27180 [Thermogemmatispora aurantia]|nr:hypothetical protein KTAU_27180 [Thermogemmatispora aurantia]